MQTFHASLDETYDDTVGFLRALIRVKRNQGTARNAEVYAYRGRRALLQVKRKMGGIAQGTASLFLIYSYRYSN